MVVETEKQLTELLLHIYTSGLWSNFYIIFLNTWRVTLQVLHVSDPIAAITDLQSIWKQN